MTFSPQDNRLSCTLLALCRKHRYTLTGAESCTGGLLSALITATPGASDVFSSAFITYSYNAKTKLLDVPSSLLQLRGAVDGQVAKSMAENALKKDHAQLAYAITGVAGPKYSERRPAGLVFIATASTFSPSFVRPFRFHGNRQDVRIAAVRQTLTLLIQTIINHDA
jgi:PncC family amidohydrolase